jgi:hypothetical protein
MYVGLVRRAAATGQGVDPLWDMVCHLETALARGRLLARRLYRLPRVDYSDDNSWSART